MDRNQRIALLALAVLLVGASATADIVVFDDAMQNGWTKKWDMSIIEDPNDPTNYVLEGSQINITAPDSAASVGNDYILEFDINTLDDTQLGILFSLETSTDSLYPFDNRNTAAVYVVDDVPVDYAAGGILLDTDPTTWQHISIDLTQTNYTGWPYVAHTFDPSTATITFWRQTLQTGSGSILWDNVVLTPEPATLALLGAGSLALLRRRKR